MATNDTTLAVNVEVNGAIANLQKFANSVQAVGQNFQSVFSKATEYTQKLVATMAAAGVATAHYADQIVDIANAHQLATAEVMGLGKALQQNGGDASKVGAIFQALSNSVEGANSGNLKTVASFQRLGVSISDLGSLSNSELKDKLFKRLSEIKDPIERNALAQDIFNKTLAGADLTKLSGDTEELTSKYKENQDAVNTAAAAFDKMGSIMGDLKVAFAVTFEPLFKYIKDLKVDVKDLVELWKSMAVALSIVTGAAVLGGFIKLIGIVKTLNTVVKGNPLIAIAGALLSIGTGMATYNAVTEQMSQTTEENTKKIEEQPKAIEQVRRSQEGLNDVIKKQQQSLQKAGAELDLNFKKSLGQLKVDLDSLKLSEDEKKVKETIAKIETDKEATLLKLKQAYDALDKDSQARNAANYQREIDDINKKAEAQKKSTVELITGTQDYLRLLKDLQATSTAYNDVQTQIFESAVKFNMEQASLRDRIELESKLTEVTKIRSALMAQTAGLSEEERNKVVDVISIATTQTDLLKKNYSDINASIAEHIRIMGQQGVISKETADKILSGTAKQRDAITVSAGALTQTNSYLMEQSRTFEYGWNRAFKQYAEDAANAAKYAEAMFAKTMQGMEDLIVNFAKTGKFEWKNFVGSLVEELLRSQLKQLMTSVFNFQSGGQTGGSFLGNLFAGMFANGGTIPGGQVGIVGERGPELVTGPATITPISGSTNVVYNISAVDAMSFKSLVARDPGFIHAVAMQGAKTVPVRR